MLTKSIIEDVKHDISKAKRYSCTKDDVYVKDATFSICLAMLLMPLTILVDIVTGIFQLIYLLVQNCIWRHINK